MPITTAFMRASTLCAAWLMTACVSTTINTAPPGPEPGTGTTSAPPPSAEEEPPPVDEPAWLTAEGRQELSAADTLVGTGIDEQAEQAAALAQQALNELVWHGAQPTFPLPQITAAADSRKSAVLPDGRFAELIAVKKIEVAQRLTAWLEAEESKKVSAGDANSPEGMLTAALSFLQRQERRRAVCAARKRLVAAECSAANTSMAVRQVHQLGAAVTLEPVLSGGVPVIGGKTARPIAVRATWEGKPWPNLPLQFLTPAHATQADPAGRAQVEPGVVVLTNEEGVASISLSEANAGDEIEVSVARERIVGHAGFWPPVRTTVLLRPVRPERGRLALGFAEFLEDEQRPEDTGARKAMAALTSVGHQDCRILGPDETNTLVAAHRGSPGSLGAALTAIADGHHGLVDFVVYAHIRSEFASRAGPRSVWHEAVATVRIYNAWTAEELESFEVAATASGVSDHNAATKAIRKVAAGIALKAASTLKARAERPTSTQVGQSLPIGRI